MPYHKRKNIVLTKDWVDVTTLSDFTDIASINITLVANFTNNAYVCIGGITKPAEDSGTLIMTGNSLSGNSDHWWVKGTGTLSVIVD